MKITISLRVEGELDGFVPVKAEVGAESLHMRMEPGVMLVDAVMDTEGVLFQLFEAKTNELLKSRKA